MLHSASCSINNVCARVRVSLSPPQSDCPQVQCISQYVAKQADELSLEPSDVINVLRKTSEGTIKIP